MCSKTDNFFFKGQKQNRTKQSHKNNKKLTHTQKNKKNLQAFSEGNVLKIAS